MPKNDGKPKGRMSSYAFFVQCCRQEHKKKHPGQNVIFDEFSKKCSEKWKEMSPKEKKRFEDMAEKDKIRYQKEMADYTPEGGAKGKAGGKRKKDPNAPKRALSAFFIFCNEFRPEIRASHPGWGVGEIAKELGKRWEKQGDKSKFEALAEKDRKRYDKEMTAYRAGQSSSSSSKGKGSPAKKAKVVAVDDDDDDDEEEEEEDEDEDDDDDE